MGWLFWFGLVDLATCEFGGSGMVWLWVVPVLCFLGARCVCFGGVGC